MKTLIKIVLTILLFSNSLDGISQSKIDQSKEELKKGSKRSNRSSSSSSSDNNLFQAIVLESAARAFIFVTYYSFIGNYAGEKHLHSDLTWYPWYNNFSGNYENPDSIHFSRKNIRFDLENKLLFSPPDLFGNHFKSKIRPFKFFYLQVDYFQLMEFTDIKRSQNTDLTLFNFNICYDRIRFEKFNLGWTLGVNYIGNGVNNAGFSYGLNTDVFLLKKLSLYGSMKLCLINNVPVNEYEIQCKFHRSRYFLSVGYEHLKIATPTYNFISAGGGIYF